MLAKKFSSFIVCVFYQPKLPYCLYLVVINTAHVNINTIMIDVRVIGATCLAQVESTSVEGETVV
jgi:hypothetical protein